jgi:hypothetical protein
MASALTRYLQSITSDPHAWKIAASGTKRQKLIFLTFFSSSGEVWLLSIAIALVQKEPTCYYT